MNNDQLCEFWKYARGTDMDFFEEVLAELTEEEFQRFLDENPEFLKE